MKRISVLLLFFQILFTFSACQNPVNVIMSPYNQANTKWVSEDNNITFTVDNNCCSTGEMKIDGENIRFYLVDDMGSGVYLYSLKVLDTKVESPEDQYEYWLCVFKSKEEFIATVEETTYFEVGQKIKFHKVEQ